MPTSSSNIAVINIPHTESEASAKKLLESLGYTVKGAGPELKSKLTKLIPHRQTIRTQLKQHASFSDFKNCGVYFTTRPGYAKSLMQSMPHMKDRIVWYEIISGPPGVGGKMAHKRRPLEVPCRYMGANKWYADDSPYPVSGPRYVLWPPIANPERYLNTQRVTREFNAPVCLVNNVKSWGHGNIVEPLTKQGVKFHGKFNKDVSNQSGFVDPNKIPRLLSQALCYVHAKSKDCPGYSLYQALMTACPVIVSNLFIRNTGYCDLYEDGVTCLIANDNPDLSKEKRTEFLTREYLDCLSRLRDPTENKRIGEGGRQRLLKLMWSKERSEDLESLRSFING